MTGPDDGECQWTLIDNVFFIKIITHLVTHITHLPLVYKIPSFISRILLSFFSKSNFSRTYSNICSAVLTILKEPYPSTAEATDTTMKITTFLYSALFTITTVLANPVAEAQKHHFCYRPGEPCSKARRALDELSSIHKRTALANAEAIAEAQKPHFCYRPGEPCSKLKRDAVPEAIAEALADAEARHHFCYRPGEACSKLKARGAEPKAIAEALANAEAKHHFCYRPGEPCSKLKRAAEAAAEAMAFPEALPEPEAEADTQKHHFCYRPGEPCSKARRSALALAEAIPIAEAQKPHFCYRPGEPCSKAKRDALAAAEAEAEAVAEAQKPHFCYRPGEPCSKSKRDARAKAVATVKAQEYCDSLAGPCFATKRFAAAIADAIAEPAAKLESEEEKEVQKRCYAEGGACAVSKRAVEELNAMVWKF